MPDSLLYLTTLLIWGSTWLAIKFQLGVVTPELSVSYRFLLSAILLLIFVLIRRLKLRFPLRAHAYIALQGFFLFSFNYILIYYSEQILTSGLVAIVFSLIVVTNTLFGAIFLKSRIRWQVLIGGLIGIFGLALIFWPEIRSFSLTSDRALGLGLALGGTISASLGNILSARNQKHQLPIVQSNMFGMAYGSGFMFLLSFLRGAPLQFEWTSEYVISLLYLSLFGSVIAFGSYLTLLGRIGPDRSAYVTVLFPVVALTLSTIFEDLTWNLLAILGVVFVIAGNAVALIRRGNRTHKTANLGQSKGLK